MKVKKAFSFILICKLLINSLLPPQTREGRKTLTLESMTSPHRRGTDVRLAALDSFLVFVGCGFFSPHQHKAVHWENLKTVFRRLLQWQLCSTHLLLQPLLWVSCRKIKCCMYLVWRDFPTFKNFHVTPVNS